MVIRKPLKVLVCLAIAVTTYYVGTAWAYDGTLIAASPGVEADALSAEPSIVTVQPGNPTYRPAARYRVTQPQYPARATRALPAPQPSYNPQLCPPTGPGGSAYYGSPSPLVTPYYSGPFPSLGFLGLRPLSPYSVLPRPGCKQFQVVARLWRAGLNGTTSLWGGNLIGGAGTEVDLKDDLDMGRYGWYPEYEASFQMRPNWSFRYSYMRIQYEATRGPDVGNLLNILWGNANFFALGAGVVESEWDRIINRWELVYNWFQARHAVSSIFAGYSLYDDRKFLLQRAAPFPAPAMYARTRSVNMHLAHAGVSIERIIRDIGGNGTVSINCRWSMQFLEGYFGWDGMATARVSVPMNCGRYGFLEAGWRWIVLNYDRPADKDKISMDGLTGSIGLVF